MRTYIQVYPGACMCFKKGKGGNEGGLGTKGTNDRRQSTESVGHGDTIVSERTVLLLYIYASTCAG